MYSPFILDHREFVLDDTSRVRLWDLPFNIGKDLAERSLHPPDISLIIDKNGSVLRQMIVIEFWLESMLKTQPRLMPLERLLIETVLLNKATQMIEETGYTGIACASIGAMIQQRLMLLLSNVEKTQWGRIQSMHKLHGIDSMQWQTHMAGADAAAYVLNRLSHRENARIFLPTIQEDVKLGIDLFWIEHPFQIAISVKCSGGNEMSVWYDPERTFERNEMEIFFRNVQTLNNRQGVSFEPILVHVGNRYSKIVSIHDDFDKTWATELLEKMHDHRRRGMLSLVPNS